MKTKVLTLDKIKSLVDIPELIHEIENGFVQYSKGVAIVPPVGFLSFDEPPGDVHFKYGYLRGDDYYVMKVASAFYRNSDFGLPNNNGLILVFNQKTGGAELILLDEGWLTDVRTAAAGAVAAKHLAANNIHKIGIVGTGVQAKLQLEFLKTVVDCTDCLVWGRDVSKTQKMIDELASSDTIQQWGIDIKAADSLNLLVSQCNLIITTTSAKEPLIYADHVQTGTHITAMGADDHGKQELESQLLKKADVVVADSISQCVDHGECFAAIRDKHVRDSDILELGDVIENPELGRTSQEQVTICDLTGVAVQDIQIAKMVAKTYLKHAEPEGVRESNV